MHGHTPVLPSLLWGSTNKGVCPYPTTTPLFTYRDILCIFLLGLL
jgi:hypothetical protein